MEAVSNALDSALAVLAPLRSGAGEPVSDVTPPPPPPSSEEKQPIALPVVPSAHAHSHSSRPEPPSIATSSFDEHTCTSCVSPVEMADAPPRDGTASAPVLIGAEVLIGADGTTSHGNQISSEPSSSSSSATSATSSSSSRSGWNWFNWNHKSSSGSAAGGSAAGPSPNGLGSPVSPTAASAAHQASLLQSRMEYQRQEALRLAAVAEYQSLKAAREQAEKAEVDARKKAEKAERQAQAAREKAERDRKRDHLGGTKHPWMHSVMRYSLNRFFGFEDWEEGMEERYRVVLCRELVTLETEMTVPPELADPDLPTPSLLLEMSHFYPAGCHNTPLPVILIRTPYDRAMMRHTAERICQHGYHCVVQDTRNSPNDAAVRAKKDLAKMAQLKFEKETKLAAAKAEVRRLKKVAQAYNNNTTSPTTPADGNADPSASIGTSSSDAAPSNASFSAAAALTADDDDPAPTSSALPKLTAAPEEFFPIVHESTDGLATLDWIAAQPWCDGQISFYGCSYLGIAQYAIVDHRHPALKCIVPVVSASRVYPILYPEGALNLDLTSRWLFMMFHPSVTGAVDDSSGVGGGAFDIGASAPSFWKRSYARLVGSRSVVPKALNHLPACELDERVAGRKLGFFQEMIRHGHDEHSAFWKEKQVKLCDLANSPPLLIVEGWFDLFLHEALRDYTEALQIYKSFQADIAAGVYGPEELAWLPAGVRTIRPYLTILNCVHIDVKQLYRVSLTESIAWFDAHMKPHKLKSGQTAHRPPEQSVRVQMINASAVNQDRHLALIAKRKKAEKKHAKKLAAAVAAVAASSAGAVQPASETDPLRVEVQRRQDLLDAEWRYFPEFPPPNATSVNYFLHCDVDEKGVAHRVLRLESPRERDARRCTLPEDAPQSSPEASDTVIVDFAAAPPTALSSDTARAVTIATPPTASIASSTRLLPSRPFSCFTYDPASPTPAIGGTCFDIENSGPLDNRPMEGRSDVLVFTSPPLTAPLVVVGFVRCTLYVRSNVPCTDFVARLLDVYPADEFATSSDRKSGSGKSQTLCDGLFRVTPVKIDDLTVEKGLSLPPTSSKRRNNDLVQIRIQPASAPASSLPPADLVSLSFFPTPIVDQTPPLVVSPDLSTPLLKLDVDMWSTGNVFQVGHRLRFHVCSAAHPRWLRSLGGADPMFFGLDHAKVQHQVVYHDATRPSALVLPVLPE